MVRFLLLYASESIAAAAGAAAPLTVAHIREPVPVVGLPLVVDQLVLEERPQTYVRTSPPQSRDGVDLRPTRCAALSACAVRCAPAPRRRCRRSVWGSATHQGHGNNLMVLLAHLHGREDAPVVLGEVAQDIDVELHDSDSVPHTEPVARCLLARPSSGGSNEPRTLASFWLGRRSGGSTILHRGSVPTEKIGSIACWGARAHLWTVDVAPSPE